MRQVLLAVLCLSLAACAWLLDQIPQPPVPSPTPAPTPGPSPSPSPAPEPTPSPGPAQCAMPYPQEAYWPIPGGVDVFALAVRQAIQSVVAGTPARFQGSALAGDVVKLLTLDGVVARHEQPGADEARHWLYAAVVTRLRADGYCVMAFGVDQLVIGANAERVKGYHLVNHGGGDVHYWPPRYEGDLEVRVGAPATCPAEAPPVDKFRLHVSAAGTFPRGRRVDATPVARGEPWCLSQGFVDLDGSGQGRCPYGQEGAGEARRRACEAREGPYKWSQRETSVWLDLPADARNPLQAWVAVNYFGAVRVCAATGACSEVEVRP